jgi:hypothetical protein
MKWGTRKMHRKFLRGSLKGSDQLGDRVFWKKQYEKCRLDSSAQKRVQLWALVNICYKTRKVNLKWVGWTKIKRY